MCLGDSITLGVGGGGYREPLGSLLQQYDGPNWDYVGPIYGGGGKHAGYNGWTIKQILTVAENDMLVHQPTHLLLMAGTNDFFYQGDTHPQNKGLGANVTVAVERMEALLKLVHDTLPKIEAVILSGVTQINATLCGQYSKAPWHPQNCPISMPDDIRTFNEQMATFASKSHKVFFHDPNCNRTDAQACAVSDAVTWADGDYFTWGSECRPTLPFSRGANRALKRLSSPIITSRGTCFTLLKCCSSLFGEWLREDGCPLAAGCSSTSTKISFGALNEASKNGKPRVMFTIYHLSRAAR